MVETGLGVGGCFYVEIYARPTLWERLLRRDGKLKWKGRAKNILPNNAINDVLNVYFGASGQTTTFYCGLIDNAGYSALGATDTMSSHAGWVENQNISNASRPTWTPGAAASQSIANPSAMVLNMNPSSGCTIRGFFLCSNNTLGGTAGNLTATALLTTPQPCNNGDTIKATYVINGTTT